MEAIPIQTTTALLATEHLHCYKLYFSYGSCQKQVKHLKQYQIKPTTPNVANGKASSVILTRFLWTRTSQVSQFHILLYRNILHSTSWLTGLPWFPGCSLWVFCTLIFSDHPTSSCYAVQLNLLNSVQTFSCLDELPEYFPSGLWCSLRVLSPHCSDITKGLWGVSGLTKRF